jgi:ATP-binding cassette subfamily F protein 3
MEEEAPTHLIPKVRDMLGSFLFRGDDVYKPLSVLSGGEKSRLALLRMLLKPMNLLILDEPTNHLDLQSKDILLKCLKDFKGTVIFVSHDRGFMEALSTKTLELGGGKHRLFYGNYGYYIEKEEGVRDQGSGIRGEERGASEDNFESLRVSVPPCENSREEQKKRQARIRKLQKREEEILAEIEKLEAEKKRLEAELSRPDVYSNGEKAKAVKQSLDKTTHLIEEKNAAWEEAARELGSYDKTL